MAPDLAALLAAAGAVAAAAWCLYRTRRRGRVLQRAAQRRGKVIPFSGARGRLRRTGSQ